MDEYNASNSAKMAAKARSAKRFTRRSE